MFIYVVLCSRICGRMSLCVLVCKYVLIITYYMRQMRISFPIQVCGLYLFTMLYMNKYAMIFISGLPHPYTGIFHLKNIIEMPINCRNIT